MFRTGVVLFAFLEFFGRSVQADIILPTVTLDNATVTGITNGLTNQFLGIPYAQPPCVA